MGCCVSCASKSIPSTSPKPRDKLSESRRAILQAEEEITVKEVLSETPKWNYSTTLAELEAEKTHKNVGFEKFKEETKVEKQKKKTTTLFVNKMQDVSEASSFSETTSTITTISDQKEERDETRKRVDRSQGKFQKNRSFSGDFSCRGDRTVHGARNVRSVRMVQSKDQMGNGRMCRRQDPGEQSFQRVKSPAMHADAGAGRSVVGRSQSARRTNRTPAAVRSSSAANSRRKKENSAVEGRWGSASETLENPLVSLECFIFL